MSFWRDINMFVEWAHANFCNFNKTKCKILHLDWGNSQHQHKLWDKLTGKSSVEKDFGILVDEKLELIWQCVLGVHKVTRALGCIKRSVTTSRT